jgi:glucose/arabinose dehydrogenase
MSKQAHDRHRTLGSLAIGLGAALALTAGATLAVQAQPKAAGAAPCGDNGGITLAPGFCATVFADNLGHVRHITFGPGGALYANIWSGSYYAGSPVPPGGFLLQIKAAPGGAKADVVNRFGETPADGAAGGTGVAVYKGAVYAEVNDRIVRYALPPGGGAPAGKPEVVLSGMPLGGDHPMHPFIIDPKGQIFVDMGTATNSCQAKNRTANVPGAEPCTETETRGGIWRYDANKLGQKFSPAERYATGLRNGEGMAFDAAGRLFVTQHGRDQLLQNWRSLYPDAAMATELPAEELVLLTQGADYGWPRCYFDGFQKKLVLAPEYGGDGGKAVGVCAGKQAPVAFYPAHWAPNDLAIYNAKAFPAPYQGGAFIAFHGSWNRAPARQDGYKVVFQPMRDGKPTGAYIVFADGFAGAVKDPGKAVFRPTGLAVGPDGALYIADDVKGRIWRVTYSGPANPALVSAPEPKFAAPVASSAPAAPLPVPPGSSREQVAAGDKLFHGATCGGCHGLDAKGTPLGPDLTAGTWLWGDGSLAAISDTIAKGVPAPKKYRSAMPAMGGAQLSPADLSAISAYVWAVGHPAK